MTAPRWRARVAALIACAALVAGAGSLLASRGRGPDANEQLDRTVRFLGQRATASIEETGGGTWSGVGPTDDAFSESWTARGEVEFPTGVRLLRQVNDVVIEQILTNGTMYERRAASERFLPNHSWFLYEFTTDVLQQGVSVQSALTVRRLLEMSHEPVRISDDTFRVELSVRDFIAALGAPANDVEGKVTFELTADRGGRLDRMVISADLVRRATATTREFRSTWRIDRRFKDWGLPVTIVPPAAAALDSTPSVEEERIAAAPFPVMAPGELPPGFQLLEAMYFEPQERTLDEDDCDKVTLYYANPHAEKASLDAGYSNLSFLNLDIARTACTSDDGRTAEAYAEKGAGQPEPYAVGPYRGTAATYDNPAHGRGALIVLIVDAVEIFVDSTLTEDQTRAALGRLVPFEPV